MRPAARFGWVAAALTVAALTAWWVWAEPMTPTAVRRPHDPPAADELPTVERLQADGTTDPRSREEALDEIQRSEEATLGVDEAARRRRTREQLLDARAHR